MSENGTETNELGPRQRLALASLAAGKTPAEAAAEARVARSTVYRWAKDPVFIAELRRADSEALRLLGRRILALAADAAKAIEDALQPSNPPSVRLRAAGIVAERGPVLAELVSFSERLDDLERQLKEMRR